MRLAAGRVEVEHNHVLVLPVEVLLRLHVVRFHLREQEEVGEVHVEERFGLVPVRQAERRLGAVQEAERVQFGADRLVGRVAVRVFYRLYTFIIRQPGEGLGRDGLVLAIQVAVLRSGRDGEVFRLQARAAIGVDEDKADLVRVLHHRELGVGLASRRNLQLHGALEQAEEFAAHFAVRLLHRHLPIRKRSIGCGLRPRIVRLVQSRPREELIRAWLQIQLHLVGFQFGARYRLRGEVFAFRVVDKEFHLLGGGLVCHFRHKGVGLFHIIGIAEMQKMVARLEVFVDIVARRRSKHHTGQERESS